MPSNSTHSPVSIDTRRALAMERYINHGGDVTDVLEVIFASLSSEALERVEQMLVASK